jgi:hypothetical protein
MNPLMKTELFLKVLPLFTLTRPPEYEKILRPIGFYFNHN